MGLKTQAGRQATMSGSGTVGVALFPAHDRCYREGESARDTRPRQGGDNEG